MGLRSGLLRVLAAAGAVVVAVSVGGSAGAAVSPAAAGPAAIARGGTGGTVATVAMGGRGTTTGPFGVSKTELLMNGDRLTVRGEVAAIAPAGSGFAAAVTELRLDGHLYAIPDAALGYLGQGLDLSLFDVAALPGGGRLPVRISYAGRVAPRLPGITITSAAGGVAAGYLTAASAPAFGAALARQLAADHGTGGYGSDGLFGGGVSISLAGAAAPPRPRTPAFKMHVLTMRGRNAAGKPDTGDMVYVINAGNTAYFGDPYEAGSVFYHGTARYSVPAGHYWALGVFFTIPRHGPASVRLVVDPRFTVTGNTSVTVAARSATQQVTFATPKPASVEFLSLTLVDRLGPAGLDIYSFISAGGVNFWVSPTSQPLRSGSLREFVSAQLLVRSPGPPQPDTAPTAYYLTFQGPPGVIGSQHFIANSIATVHASYSSGAATTGGVELAGITPGLLADGFLSGFVFSLSVPARETEYFTAGKNVYWTGQYFQSYATLSGGQVDATRTFTPGEVTNLGWNTYPLHTTLNSSTLGGSDPFGAALSATRSGRQLTLYVTPFSDSTTGHAGSGFSPGILGSSGKISGSYRIDDNGGKIAAGNAVRDGVTGFGTQVNLSPGTSTVSFTLHASRTGALYPLSTATTTTWTWQSAPGPVIRLPGNWACADFSTSCAVQPLLTLGYDVAGIAVDGTAPAGAQVVRLTIGHQQFAAAPDITSASASVSYDGGATWQPAAVTGAGGGTWDAVFSAPPGSYVSLKVTAGDAAGNAITETIMRAYATQAPAFGHARGSSYATACPAAGPGEARCFVLYAPVNAAARARAAGFGAVSAPAGWGARAIEQAYKLPVGRHSRQTVAVVEAFDTPRLQSYLNTYRRQYGLPPCTTANGCLRKVNGAGRAAPLPPNGTGSGWDLEATLDVDMVSAACPTCHILVVEANSSAITALAAAENTAVRLGAVAVSNSYGARENGLALASAHAYDHPGHAIVASSGDFGYTAASFPADLTTVTAVGGTELSRARNGRGWLETVWNESGAGASSSGCSAYAGKPRWQHDTHCPGRTVADVAALAWDIAVYNKDYGGWVQVGGTSASSPIVAGIYGLAGNAAKIRPGSVYAHARSLFDVTKGNDDWWFGGGGRSCGGDYLCVAKKGYDAPTGLGTPDGIGAF